MRVLSGPEVWAESLLPACSAGGQTSRSAKVPWLFFAVASCHQPYCLSGRIVAGLLAVRCGTPVPGVGPPAF